MVVVRSQSAGNGYLFRTPSGTLAIRGGYTLATSSSQSYTDPLRQTTVGPRSLDPVNLAMDLGFNLTRRVDLILSVDGSTRSTTPEYREWEEDGRPIEHTSTLDKATIGGSLRFNLKDRGRPISAFAWIPARYVPYVGVGGGMVYYSLRQKGDFVEAVGADQQSANIYTDELESSGWGKSAHLFGGLDYKLTAQWSLLGEARYTRASARLNDDYSDLGRIDLSGMTINFGTTIRF
jgi:hypothetical protein